MNQGIGVILLCAVQQQNNYTTHAMTNVEMQHTRVHVTLALADREIYIRMPARIFSNLSGTYVKIEIH
jgi:hypothetical protein